VLSVTSDGESIRLVFTPNPPPVVNPVTLYRGSNLTWKLSFADLLTNVTANARMSSWGITWRPPRPER